MALIRTLEQFSETVKVTISGAFSSLLPFIEDAQRIYLERYLGQTLIERLEDNFDAPSDKEKVLIKKIQNALGPFSYLVAADESSIRFGDAGHTVTRTDVLTPASDAKILAAKESAKFRAWQNVEQLLNFLEASTDFPEWKECDYITEPKPKYFLFAKDFQVYGNIDIKRSRLTYEKLMPLIRNIELTEIDDLLQNLEIAKPFDSNNTAAMKKLVSFIQLYIAHRVAAIHTSQLTHDQRAQQFSTEYKPTIRPLYENLEKSLNYYQNQADYFRIKIIDILDSEFGISSQSMDFNSKEKKVFYSLG